MRSPATACPACALLAASGLRALLVGIESVDALTVSAVGALLAGVALAACYLPARRVLGIQPARLLRD